MQFIPTNDVFHHLIYFLQLREEKELICEIFESQNIEVTN